MTSPKEALEEEQPLVGEAEAAKEPLRPLPIRAIHAGMHFVFCLFGKEYGWMGFLLLVCGTACSVATSVHVNWLAGCAMMMLFFGSVFCFAGYQAVSGKYELARPLMLGAMMMFLSCILGGHFFVVWSKSAGSQVIKDVKLSQLSSVAKGYENNAFFYLKDGQVAPDYGGMYKLCKDKLPVVGTCVYNYYCVAPVLDAGYQKGMPAYAWVGIMSHVECTDKAFSSSPEALQWKEDYKAGLGIKRNVHWNKAVADAAAKYGFKTTSSAPVLKWLADPTADEKKAWHTGWMVEFIVFTLYLFCMLIYAWVTGISEGALEAAREIMDPYAPKKPARRKKVEN